MYEESFPGSGENTQYHLTIVSEHGSEFDAFLWDDMVQKIIDLIENA